MKRTLLEVMGGLAVAVVLVSYHHRIEQLRGEQTRVERLADRVDGMVAQAERSQEVADADRRTWSTLQEKIDFLERRVADASAGGYETARLRAVLEETKLEAARFQTQIERDVTRTRELVDAFHREIEASGRQAREELEAQRSTLEVLTERVVPDVGVLNRRLLAPTVQLNGDDTVGSGTVIYSRHNPKKDTVETYVLTSYHVIRNILADTPTARRDGIAVTIYTADGKLEERADMLCYDERIDAALMRLRSEQQFQSVAACVTRQTADRVQTWDRIYAVGCPLGNDPIPTQGEISSTDNELNGANYWMINAPTYFGNSGGGVYLAETRELVGVFSKIYTHGRGNPVVVPHMGLCTPMDLIHDWLGEAGYAFVLDSEMREAIDPTEMLAAPAK